MSDKEYQPGWQESDLFLEEVMAEFDRGTILSPVITAITDEGKVTIGFLGSDDKRYVTVMKPGMIMEVATRIREVMMEDWFKKPPSEDDDA